MSRHIQPSACNEAGPNTLFLGSLAPETTERDIIEYISQFGHVSNAKIIRDAVTSISKNCGLAFCEDEDTCYNVLAESVHVIRHKQVRISWADKNKKGTKRIHSNIIHVESVDPVLHVNTIVDYFSQFGEISRSEVLRGYSGKASKKRSPCLLKVEYQSTWSVSEATKFQGEHFIRGIRVQCYVVFESENSVSPPELSHGPIPKHLSRPTTRQHQTARFHHPREDRQIEYPDYGYQEPQQIPSRPLQMQPEAWNSEFVADPKDQDELSMLEEEEASFVGGQPSFHAGSPPSKNRSLFESRSTMRESRGVSEVFADDFEPLRSEYPQPTHSKFKEQKQQIPHYDCMYSNAGQGEQNKGTARSLEWKGDPTLGYSLANRKIANRTNYGLATVSEKQVLLPPPAEAGPMRTKIEYSDRSKVPQFIPEDLQSKCNFEVQETENHQPTSRSYAIRPESKLMLVEFEKDEIFAVFFKELKLIANEETKYIKGVIRRAEFC